MKSIYRFNEEGFFTGQDFIEDHENIPEYATDVFPDVLITDDHPPLFQEGEWVEKVPASLKEQILAETEETDELVRLKEENEKLKNQMLQINADLQGFMDYYFMNGGE
jgi:molecular chaperone GrpE (heat shock protein)